MESAQKAFRKRQQAVRKKHSRMARGYVTKLDKSGVIVQRPDRKWPGMLLRTAVFLVLVFMAFKSVTLAGLGAEDFEARVAELRLGTPLERAGAWLMQPEPVSSRLAEFIAPHLS